MMLDPKADYQRGNRVPSLAPLGRAEILELSLLKLSIGTGKLVDEEVGLMDPL